jgi:ribosomal protein L20
MGRKYRDRMREKASHAPLWITKVAAAKGANKSKHEGRLGKFGRASPVRQLSREEIAAYDAELRSKRRGGDSQDP